MKKPASRALFRLRLLVLVPKEGSEMGSSILFRVSVSSERMASAVFSEECDKKLSWHHFSALAASEVKTQKKTVGQKKSWVVLYVSHVFNTSIYLYITSISFSLILIQNTMP